MNEVKCINCGSNNVMKYGIHRGKQRLFCKDCKYQSTRQQEDIAQEETKGVLKKVSVLFNVYLGTSFEKIGNLMGVCANTVLNWIKKEAYNIPEIALKSTSGVVMLDEMCLFVNGKENKIWLWRAIDGVTRQALGYVIGERSDATCQKLLDKVDDGKCVFVTDDWGSYHRLIPANRLFTGKDLTYVIEQTNSDIRNRTPRFMRRHKSSSRSLEMIHNTLKLVDHLINKSTLCEYINVFRSLFVY
jgi:insertion element IS1 protein InsB